MVDPWWTCISCRKLQKTTPSKGNDFTWGIPQIGWFVIGNFSASEQQLCETNPFLVTTTTQWLMDSENTKQNRYDSDLWGRQPEINTWAVERSDSLSQMLLCLREERLYKERELMTWWETWRHIDWRFLCLLLQIEGFGCSDWSMNYWCKIRWIFAVMKHSAATAEA